MEGLKISLGIQETKDVLAVMKAMADGISKSIADGKVDLIDLKNFAQVVLSLKKGFEGINQVGEELRDLDTNEVGELITELIDIVLIFARAVVK
jgi:hypothetical protein